MLLGIDSFTYIYSFLSIQYLVKAMRNFLYLFFIPLFLIFSLEAMDRYQLIDLGLLNYQKSEATSINSLGQICGSFKTKNKTYVFVWDPSLHTYNYVKIRTSVSPLINNKGEVFGSQILNATDNVWDYEQETLFCWKNPLNFFTFLNFNHLGFPKESAGLSPFDQKRTVLWDVNDQGEMVIMNSDSVKDFFLGSPREFKYQVWIYQKGQYKLITDPQFQIAISINNKSEVLGCYQEDFDKVHGEQKIGTSIYNLKTREIAPLPLPTNAIGKSINDIGQIIGVFIHPFTYAMQGFLRDMSGYLLILDNFNPIKANNKQLIIGKFLEGSRKGKPGIWNDGSLHDLSEFVDLIDDQGHVWDSLDLLVDLNDEGYLIGQGTYNGRSHGFLLVPMHHANK